MAAGLVWVGVSEVNSNDVFPEQLPAILMQRVILSCLHMAPLIFSCLKNSVFIWGFRMVGVVAHMQGLHLRRDMDWESVGVPGQLVVVGRGGWCAVSR